MASLVEGSSNAACPLSSSPSLGRDATLQSLPAALRGHGDHGQLPWGEHRSFGDVELDRTQMPGWSRTTDPPRWLGGFDGSIMLGAWYRREGGYVVDLSLIHI